MAMHNAFTNGITKTFMGFYVKIWNILENKRTTGIPDAKEN